MVRISSRKGFTLVEVLAALVLISLVLLPLAGILLKYAVYSRLNYYQIDASQLAQAKMEELMSGGYENLVTGFGEDSVVDNGITFKRRWSVTRPGENLPGDVSSSLLQVNVVVSFAYGGINQSKTLSCYVGAP